MPKVAICSMHGGFGLSENKRRKQMSVCAVCKDPVKCLCGADQGNRALENGSVKLPMDMWECVLADLNARGHQVHYSMIIKQLFDQGFKHSSPTAKDRIAELENNVFGVVKRESEIGVALKNIGRDIERLTDDRDQILSLLKMKRKDRIKAIKIWEETGEMG